MMNMTTTSELMHYALRNHLSRLKDDEGPHPVCWPAGTLLQSAAPQLNPCKMSSL